MHTYFTCRDNLRETGLGYEPELTDWNPDSDEYDGEGDPLMAWIEEDGLTLTDHPHITAGGSIFGSRMKVPNGWM